MPYYYANNAYYTWNPGYSGYIATDPPPAVSDPSGSATAPGAPLPQPAPGYNGGYNGPPPGAAPQSAPSWDSAPMQQQSAPQIAPESGPGPEAAPGSAPGATAPGAYPLPNAAPAPTANPTSLGLQAQLNMYPRNGQSTNQESVDRRDCEQWAQHQAGSGASGSDYQRAMVACVEGRGYAVE